MDRPRGRGRRGERHRPHRGERRAGLGTIDRVVVDGAVRGTGAVILAGGDGVARTQSGRIRTYVAFGIAAVALILILGRIF